MVVEGELRSSRDQPGSSNPPGTAGLAESLWESVGEWLGWEEGGDLNSWIGRIQGGWERQLEVLRSAPLMMMMMDVEDQFKTKWKRRWRKAISGDPEKRIRDHMDDKEVQKRIRLVDTASFTLGVFMAMWAEYLMLASPAAFPWFYLVTLTLLMLLRYTTYRAINNHFFMLDFCYFMQISVITQTLLFPPTSAFGAAWFKANFALSHGPIAIAILAWQNSMVFHSLDKMTSFYIHIMPPLTCYMQRWAILPGGSPPDSITFGFGDTLITPLILYGAWQAAYLYVQQTVIDHDKELVTSLRYLTQCPRNPMHIITMDVCTRLGVLAPGEVYHPDQTKTKVIFVVGQLIYAILWLLPTPIFFHFRFLNTTFLLVLVVAGIWRGGSYYIFVFSKVYNKKFEPDQNVGQVEKKD